MSHFISKLKEKRALKKKRFELLVVFLKARKIYKKAYQDIKEIDARLEEIKQDIEL